MSHGRFQHTSYVLSIRLLLTSITTDQELHDMMDDTDNALWKSDDIADALQRKLGDAYQAYMRTIRQIEGITKSLAEKLDIEGADKVCDSAGCRNRDLILSRSANKASKQSSLPIHPQRNMVHQNSNLVSV
jgi:hypothetical protein